MREPVTQIRSRAVACVRAIASAAAGDGASKIGCVQSTSAARSSGTVADRARLACVDTRVLEASFAGIAEELRRQYSLGYYPEKVGQAGERRRISVRVMRPNVMVKAKNTYIFGQADKRFGGT